MNKNMIQEFLFNKGHCLFNLLLKTNYNSFVQLK